MITLCKAGPQKTACILRMEPADYRVRAKIKDLSTDLWHNEEHWFGSGRPVQIQDSWFPPNRVHLFPDGWRCQADMWIPATDVQSLKQIWAGFGDKRDGVVIELRLLRSPKAWREGLIPKLWKGKTSTPLLTVVACTGQRTPKEEQWRDHLTNSKHIRKTLNYASHSFQHNPTGVLN